MRPSGFFLKKKPPRMKLATRRQSENRSSVLSHVHSKTKAVILSSLTRRVELRLK